MIPHDDNNVKRYVNYFFFTDFFFAVDFFFVTDFFFAAGFFLTDFFFAVFFFLGAGPCAALSASIPIASSNVISSTIIPLRNETLVVPSVT